MIRVRMSCRSSRGSSERGLRVAPGMPSVSFVHMTMPKPWGHKLSKSDPFVPRDYGEESLAPGDRPNSSPDSKGVPSTTGLQDLQLPVATNDVKNKSEATDAIHETQDYTLITSNRPGGGHSPRMTVQVESPVLPRSSSLSSKTNLNSQRKHSRVSFDMESPNVAISQTHPWLAPTSEAHATPDDVGVGLVDSQISYSEPTSSGARWQRILRCREENWSLRSRIQEIRRDLRHKQEVKSAADDVLVRRINAMIHMGNNSLSDESGFFSRQGQKNLEQLREECQTARDAYGPLEDQCNHLEDQLSRQEFKLTQLEKDFYGSSDELPKMQMEQVAAGYQEPEIRYAATSSIPSQEDDDFEDLEYHPLVSKYLSKLGDLDLHRERLFELIDDKEQLEEERERRLQFGFTLEAEDQSWLDNAPKEIHELEEKIRLLDNELETMKQECVSKGLLDQDGEPTSFQSQEEKSFEGEEEMDSRGQKSEYVKHSLLLPHPGIFKNEDLGDFEPKPDKRSEPLPAAHRVNKWMLQKLRSSPLDVNLLARTFEEFSGITDREWEVSVLDFWYNDGTFKSSARIHVTSTRSRSMTTQAALEHPNSETSDSPPAKAKKDPSFRILVASSVLNSSDRSDATQVAFFLGSSQDSPISPRHTSDTEK